MKPTTNSVNNGVNAEALVAARDALVQTPEAAELTWAWEADFGERGRTLPDHSGWSDGVRGRWRTASNGSERGINAG